jgi:hypothetical protein
MSRLIISHLGLSKKRTKKAYLTYLNQEKYCNIACLNIKHRKETLIWSFGDKLSQKNAAAGSFQNIRKNRMFYQEYLR